MSPTPPHLVAAGQRSITFRRRRKVQPTLLVDLQRSTTGSRHIPRRSRGDRRFRFHMEEQLGLGILRDDWQKDGEPVGGRPTRSADTNPPRRLDDYGEVLTVEEAAAVLRISRSSCA